MATIIALAFPQLALSQPQGRAEGEHALAIGDSSPRLSGDALSGRRIEIPSAAARVPTVVLFSFSKAGGDDARRWNERLRVGLDSTSHADVVIVLELQSAPRLIRGFVVAGIKRGVPPVVRDQMLVLTTDEALWKRRLSVTTTDHCYVTVVAPSGRIQWMSTAAFSESEFQRLREALRT